MEEKNVDFLGESMAMEEKNVGFSEESMAVEEKDVKSSKVFIVLFLGLCILTVILFPEISKQYAYYKAENLIARGEYKEAMAKLEKIESKNIKDTESLIKLCEAHIAYSNNDIPTAWFKMSDISFSYQTKAQKDIIDAFKKNVDEKFDSYIAEEVKKEAKKSGLPFVGMSESDIGNTSLGEPYSKTLTAESINGENCLVNLYDFRDDSRTIFRAKCVLGEVVGVWDKREKPKNTEPKNTYTPSTKSLTKKKKKKNYDIYNASEYDDAEEFYYDYEDEFYNFDEAEEYYNEYSD